jgi:hypothetical protein
MPDSPVFILGERAPATALLHALGSTPDFCAMPPNRLLYDLLLAMERSYGDLDDLSALWADGPPAARWYREVQRARAAQEGKPRTVEFSGLAVARLRYLFPEAQFVVVHTVRRPLPRSRRIPALPPGKLLEVDPEATELGSMLHTVLEFLAAAPPARVVDIRDAPLARKYGSRYGPA